MTAPRKKTERKFKLWNSRSEFSTRKDTLMYKRKKPANLMKTSKTCSEAITKEMLDKRTQRIQKAKNAASTPQENTNQTNIRTKTAHHAAIKTSQKFNDLPKLANYIYLKIKVNTKEFKNREHTAFNKIQPNKEDLQALNEITTTLVTTQPEINPTLYL